MNPSETREFGDLVRKLRDDLNLTIGLIEHDMGFVMDVCHKIKVIDHGIPISWGIPERSKTIPSDRSLFGRNHSLKAETPVLQIENLHVRYGGINALKGISLRVDERKIVTLLGANGAGKSTTIRAVSGIIPLASGEVFFQGQSIKNLPAHAIQRLGLVHVPEGRKIFANLTVRENLIMGAYNNRDKADVARTTERVFSTFQYWRPGRAAWWNSFRW